MLVKVKNESVKKLVNQKVEAENFSQLSPNLQGKNISPFETSKLQSFLQQFFDQNSDNFDEIFNPVQIHDDRTNKNFDQIFGSIFLEGQSNKENSSEFKQKTGIFKNDYQNFDKLGTNQKTNDKLSKKSENKVKKSGNNPKFVQLRKTEMCHFLLDYGGCPHAKNCQFAHNENELRKVVRHPKYRTTLCRQFFGEKGFCPYGRRCEYIHHIEQNNPKNNNSNDNKSNNFGAQQKRLPVFVTLSEGKLPQM